MMKLQKGRPTSYSKELAEEICNAIASNSKGIKLLCRERLDWPNQDTIFRDDGKVVFNAQAVNRARLKIDTRKWLASKLVPRVYGQKPNEGCEQNAQPLQEIMERRERLDAQYRKEY